VLERPAEPREGEVAAGLLTLPVRAGLAVVRPADAVRLSGDRVAGGARWTVGTGLRATVGARVTVDVRGGTRLTVPVRVGAPPIRPTVGVRPYVLGGRRSTVVVRPGL
jgi:hypothetical protein